MTGHRALIALAAGPVLALAGCGGGTRQDADEPAGRYTVAVTQASFPKRQNLARAAVMRIAVKNTGAKALPDVAVTVDSFNRRSEQAGLADASRPIWVVDREPRGGTTAYVDTWALDGLRPGQTRTFLWRVTPIEAGRHRIRWTVAAGLDGRARVRTASGEAPVSGTFGVDISSAPSSARVDPATGAVIREGETSAGQ